VYFGDYNSSTKVCDFCWKTAVEIQGEKSVGLENVCQNGVKKRLAQALKSGPCSEIPEFPGKC
jgi:hypothetical protein